MAKPRLIILIRHGQSEGNKNREIHQTTPDHRVKLTPEGVQQARDAGLRLRHLLRPDDTLHFFTSPYRRTRETTEGILETLTSDAPGPSPFRRSAIKVYEEPRLREQDFGNFQPCSAEMERMWQERADYGHFFYRIPNGESAADAYDRVSGFNESLWRQFGEDDFASVCVLVTHGLMSRVFLMKWYHFTVEYFEDLRNVNHCEFLIMRKQDNGKYFLENTLRTWSTLRRERAALAAEQQQHSSSHQHHSSSHPHSPAAQTDPARDRDSNSSRDRDKDKDKISHHLGRSKTYKSLRRWGGCPNGCNHSSHYKRRDDLEIMREKDDEQLRQAVQGSSGASLSPPSPSAGGGITMPRRPARHTRMISSDGDDEQSDALTTPGIDIHRSLDDAILGGSSTINNHNSKHNKETAERSSKEIPPLQKMIRSDRKHYLHLGRDFGGTYSGHASAADSDDADPSAEEEEENHRQQQQRRSRKSLPSAHSYVNVTNEDAEAAPVGSPRVRVSSPDVAGGERFVNRLGDAGSDAEVEPVSDYYEEDLEAAERRDRSIRGSVY